jgi:calcineurin-like phosphoesterase family protein
MTTFITSDLHLGHVNILKYQRSNFFADLHHMQEGFTANWNSVISDDDTVYVLGDVVMGKRSESLPLLDRLNGRKIIIWGNHDYPHPCNPDDIVERWTPEYEKYFVESHLSTTINVGGESVLLHHFPANVDHTDDTRYMEFRPNFDGIIVHGHVHSRRISVEPNHIHVGIDADWTDYGVPRHTPIPFNALEQAVKEVANA